ncbi:50S ribosomal protein L22 [Candidatus Woesearchaeota archaeon]|nr:50S ribosomal protein L22 [Candidatus Woesearchaeota archaeon]
MAKYKYASKIENGKNAKAVGRDLPASIKHSLEVCNMIRNKNVEKAKKTLMDVIGKKEAVPYRKFQQDLAHRKNIGPGRFPVKTCENILETLKAAEANAVFKGLGKDLFIKSIVPQRAAKQWHYGRKRRRHMKRAHIEIVLESGTPKEIKKIFRPFKRMRHMARR